MYEGSHTVSDTSCKSMSSVYFLMTYTKRQIEGFIQYESPMASSDLKRWTEMLLGPFGAKREESLPVTVLKAGRFNWRAPSASIKDTDLTIVLAGP